MTECLIALGANLGDTEKNVRRAIELIDQNSGIRVQRSSSIHSTDPIGGPQGQGMFSNAAILAKTNLNSRELLEILLKTELEFGRRRDIRWQARTLDLDLLLHNDQIVAEADFIVPHPRMSFRRFVLEPSVEVAPQMRHPIACITLSQLLESINRSENLIGFCSQNIKAARNLAMEVGDLIAADVLSLKNYKKNPEPNEIQQPANSPQLNTPVPYTICFDYSKTKTFEPKLTVALVHCENKNPDRLQEYAKKTLLADIDGPYLVLDADNIEGSRDELIAAIDAMK